MDLTDVQRALDEEDFVTKFVPGDEEQPVDQLFVLLDSDEVDQALTLELLFMPVDPDQLEELRLLQFFVELPFTIEARALGDLRELLLRVNVQLPLGAFGLHEEDDLLFFRYVLALPVEPGDHEVTVIRATVWLAFYLVESFVKQIQSVASGQLS